jgi:hypothetical protein
MTTELIKSARKEQTQVELERLRTELEAWLAHRRTHDSRGQYKTQLQAIESMLQGALAFLAPKCRALDLSQSLNTVYEECRIFDLRLVWLRRIWEFFKTKFDQRDDPRTGDLLRGADEVVWSCYRQVFAQAQQRFPGLEQGPAPLPYLEPSYSPEAFPAQLVPDQLADPHVAADFVKQHLLQLPVPLVRLPPACLSAPWWLVLLGHEVGHHIQYSLLERTQLVSLFRTRVEEAVAQHARSASEQDRARDVKRWGRWSCEIFADVFSVLVMGPWAVWAMVDLELQQAETMLQRRDQYPAAVVRLEILARTASALGLDVSEALHGLELSALVASAPATAHDGQFVQSVVATALAGLPGLPDASLDPPTTLAVLCDFWAEEFAPNKIVATWARALRGRERPRNLATLRSARLMACAALQAWPQVMTYSEEERKDQRQALAARVLELLPECREPGVRGQHAPDSNATDLGARLAEQLWAVHRNQLEGQ